MKRQAEFKQLTRRRYILFGFVLLAIFAWFSLDSKHSVSAVLASPKQTTAAKTLRRIVERPSKAICGKPKKGFARCGAYAVTDTNGNLLTATPLASGGYGPVEFHTAYNLPCTPGGPVANICSTPGSFGPQTIAIVVAGNLTTGGATVESSLQTYNQYYGLPACTVANGCLKIVNQSGASSPLPASAGWDTEIALDVEAAHMICQTCIIVLVEANTNSAANLSAANVTAASFNPISISNSWIVYDYDYSVYDSSFIHPGIATVAGTGDSGSHSSGKSWPADIPDVVSVSGTSLGLNADNTWASETVWSGSGGGCAIGYPAPSWQTSLSNWATNGCGTNRAYGDISADANPSTGMVVSVGSTWLKVGGTSLSTPLIAAMFALAGSIPAGSTASSIPYSPFNNTNFHDVLSGSNCTSSGQLHCTAAAGFDTPTGVGAPIGLGGFSPPPSQPTGLSTTVVDQNHVSLSWTASTGNQAISTYKIYRDGNQIASTSSTSYSNSNLIANTNYTYHVVAVDALGNVSPASSNSSATTYYLADLNQDGHINLLDFSLLASKFNQSGAGLGRSDINNDSTVNILDFSLLASVYGIE